MIYMLDLKVVFKNICLTSSLIAWLRYLSEIVFMNIGQNQTLGEDLIKDLIVE